MENQSFKYNKHQKIKSRKLVENLFSKGKSLLAFPVKLVYSFEKAENATVLSGIGVSKKYFKKAHDRNYIKRLLRESFRHHQQSITEYSLIHKLRIHFFMLYVHKELPSYEVLQLQMPNILKKLALQITNESLDT